jgi:hypothetical protein
LRFLSKLNISKLASNTHAFYISVVWLKIWVNWSGKQWRNSILVITKAVIWVYQVLAEMKILHHILVMEVENTITIRSILFTSVCIHRLTLHASILQLFASICGKDKAAKKLLTLGMWMNSAREKENMCTNFWDRAVL